MLPLALSVIGKSAVLGRVIVTVNAGLTVATGVGLAFSVMAADCLAKSTAAPAANAAATLAITRMGLSFIIRS